MKFEEHLSDLEEGMNFRKKALNELVKTKLKPGSVLDVGCGTGDLACELALEGRKANGIDISRECVKKANARAKSFGLGKIFAKADFMSAEVKGKFDNVLVLDVLEHVENDEKALRRLRSLVKPGGGLVISVPAHQWLYGQHDKQMGHYRRYARKQLNELLANAGWQVGEMREWNCMSVVPSYVSKLLSLDIHRARYSTNVFKKMLNELLYLKLKLLENNVPFPVGVTLFAVCERGVESV